MDIFSVIRLICGLTFFLFGMKVMSGDLEKLACAVNDRVKDPTLRNMHVLAAV